MKIMTLPIITIAFESLYSEDLFEATVDFIVALFRETRNMDCNPEDIQLLYDQLETLKPLLNGSNTDTFSGVVRIFAEAAEAALGYISQDLEKYRFLIHSILQCTRNKKDFDVVKVTFKFWSDLSQLVTSEDCRNTKDVFRPVYFELAEIIVGHLRCLGESDRAEQKISPGNLLPGHKFRDFDDDLKDVLVPCRRVIGSTCLNKIYSIINGDPAERSHRNIVFDYGTLISPRPSTIVRFQTLCGSWYRFDRINILGR